MVAQKRERERTRPALHVKRVFGQVKLETQDGTPKFLEVRILLNDISAQKIGLFSTEPALVGQNVALTLEHPRRIYVKGRITQCQEFTAHSHVMSQVKYSYRIGIHCTFNSPVEAEEFAKFCAELGNEEVQAGVAA